MTGKHRKVDLPKRVPGKAGNAQKKAAQDAASKGGGKIIEVNVKKS